MEEGRSWSRGEAFVGKVWERTGWWVDKHGGNETCTTVVVVVVVKEWVWMG